MRAITRFLPLACLVLLLAQSASAHTSLESSLSFWLRPTGIDVRIYLSRGNTDMLLARPNEQLTIVRDNFPSFQKRIAAGGPALLSLATADGVTLKPDASDASLTDEDDICFTLHYPLPRTLPATLKIHGNYLDKMDEGHIGDIYVLNATNDQLATGEIRAESPDLEVRLPAVVPANQTPAISRTSPPATSKPPASSAPASPSWLLWALLGAGLAAFTLLIWRGWTLYKAEPKDEP